MNRILIPLILAIAPGIALADSISINEAHAASNPSAVSSDALTAEYVHNGDKVSTRSWVTQSTKFGLADTSIGSEAWIKQGSWVWQPTLEVSPTHNVVPIWAADLAVQRVIGAGFVFAAGIGGSSYAGTISTSTNQPLRANTGVDYYFDDNLASVRIQHTVLNGKSATGLSLHLSWVLSEKDIMDIYAGIGHGLEPISPTDLAFVYERSATVVWRHKLTQGISMHLGIGRDTESPGYTSTLSTFGLTYSF
jgi:YaiO family outer membrane protein